MAKSIKVQYNYERDLLGLLEKYKEVDTKHMGFPDYWKDQPLWKDVVK